jgi:uncharacterized membrane protein
MFGGMEIHPWVVHFPVALVTVAAFFSVLYLFLRREWLRWFAPLLLSLALLGAVASYFSGQAAEDRAEAIGVPEPAVEEHEETSIWGTGLMGLACLLAWATHSRQRGIWVSSLVAVAAAGLILWTGHLGGKLVYEYGAGRVSPGHASGAASQPETGRR